jgi:DNA polymerase (family 10)
MRTTANKNLEHIFREMSAIYQYMGGDDRFRALAYGKASKVMGSLTDDVSVYVKNNTLQDLPGIGEGIAGVIEEYLRTGKIKKYEHLKKMVPHELLEMTEIKSFGPQSLKRIHNELKISTKAELLKAMQEGKIEKLKGFGTKKVEGMFRGLKLHKTIEERMLLWDALEAGEKILEWMKKYPGVKQAELCGSLRRRKETIGDIDVLIAAGEKQRKKIIAHFTSAEIAGQILAKGDTKTSIVLNDNGSQVDLRIVNEDEWGSALQYFTGSKEHNIHLRTIAKEKGYKISEYGLFTIKDDLKIAGKTEEEIYNKLGFQTIPPEMREDKGELELSAKNKIPQLVSLQDIKGDMQMHSVWSDGMNTIEEIANYISKKFNYEYIVITDHTKSSRIANGMDEKQILMQLKSIREVNEKLTKYFIKAGIEVDILADGSLDISDEILSQLDWVTAAIHSGFNLDNTSRIIKACENKYVNCIGHPTGRLIGSREPYRLDIEQIISAANQTNTALEINAQTNRMDLNDEIAMLVRKQGVKLVISTDAHSFQNFDFMKLGVFVARRAWCTADDILNTKSWKELEKFRTNKKA